MQEGAYAAALPLLRRALAIPKPRPELRLSLAQCQFELGDIEAAVRELRRAAQDPDSNVRRTALRKIAVYAPGVPSFSNARILGARRRWARLEAKVEYPRLAPSVRPLRPRRKLRIGYVSAFLCSRNWMKPIWGTLDAHDRREFEIHLFLDRGLPDRRFGYVPRKSDRVHSLDGLTNEAAARCVADAGIDILVDISSYSNTARLGLFLRKPAPIQVSWFALYAASGIEAFDYAVADKACLPVREERFCMERILRVSGSYLAFAVRYPVPKVAAPPCTRAGHVTFGCLAPQYKIGGDVIAMFAGILRAAPSARLLLKSICLGNAANRSVIRARFLRLGIAATQLICEGPAEHFDFLKTYERIDVALDTFPYSGGTTTMEALWQGVPVLTFCGDRWASRTSCSLLQAAGLGEWVCASRQALARQAIEIARSPGTVALLRALRPTLREKVRVSPACDVRALCRQLEEHYRTIARRTLRRPGSSGAKL